MRRLDRILGSYSWAALDLREGSDPYTYKLKKNGAYNNIKIILILSSMSENDKIHKIEND